MINEIMGKIRIFSLFITVCLDFAKIKLGCNFGTITIVFK